MMWVLLMLAAVVSYVFGGAFLAVGYANDDARLVLGAILLLLAPFLFYAAGGY